MRERVEAMKAIWTQEEASYSGEHVNFERIWSHPKPVQRPHPPVLVGGDGPGVLDRVLAFGDAWLPQLPPAARVLERMEELRARAERPIEVTVVHARRRARARARRERRRAAAPCTGCPPAAPRSSSPRSSAGRPRSPSSSAVDRRRGAPAVRAGPRSRGSRRSLRARRRLVPITFALAGEVIWSAVDDVKPKRTRALRAPAITSPPTRASACSPTTTRRTGARSGGCAPTAARASSTATTPRPRAGLRALADRYRALPRAAAVRAADRDRRRALVRLVGVVSVGGYGRSRAEWRHDGFEAGHTRSHARGIDDPRAARGHDRGGPARRARAALPRALGRRARDRLHARERHAAGAAAAAAAPRSADARSSRSRSTA